MLLLMYKGVCNLHCKWREGYNNDFEAQMFLGKLCKGNVLKNVTLVHVLLKYKQS